jgi:hypothetical protein
MYALLYGRFKKADFQTEKSVCESEFRPKLLLHIGPSRPPSRENVPLKQIVVKLDKVLYSVVLRS